MKKPIYLDYMSTTPIDPRVKAKLLDYIDNEKNFGNPTSEHYYGQIARAAVEEARDEVASLINASPKEIIWTSGATEANNLGIKGAAFFYQRKGKHIITLATEHKSVLNCYLYLQSLGFEVTFLMPEKNGIIDLIKLENALRCDTILVSIMHANNEIGVIQNIDAIGAMLKPKGIIFHVDAAQSAGKIPIDTKKNQVDLISFSAHKIYGPKGIGALYIRRNPRIHLIPQMHGGEQEQNLRSGTLPTHQIVAMGEAFRIAKEEMDAENKRIFSLRQKLWNGINDLPNIHIHGDLTKRLSGNLNIGVLKIDGELLFTILNQDFSISGRAACAIKNVEPSHVLKAIGVSDELAKNSIRISLGRFTTNEEIDFTIASLRKTILNLKKY